MKEIAAYETSDGTLFEDSRQASSHQEDIIGELLDTLLPHDKRGNITMVDRHNILMEMLSSKELKPLIDKLHYALNFQNNDHN